MWHALSFCWHFDCLGASIELQLPLLGNLTVEPLADGASLRHSDKERPTSMVDYPIAPGGELESILTEVAKRHRGTQVGEGNGRIMSRGGILLPFSVPKSILRIVGECFGWNPVHVDAVHSANFLHRTDYTTYANTPASIANVICGTRATAKRKDGKRRNGFTMDRQAKQERKAW